MLDLIADLHADDLVLCLVSGGGSALFEQPVEGMTLAAMQETTRLLLRAGAPITALNSVRKHLSAVKGGQLARRVAPATLVALILSDVVGDALDVTASGPTVPDPTTFADALDMLDEYDVRATVPPLCSLIWRRVREGNIPTHRRRVTPVLPGRIRA